MDTVIAAQQGEIWKLIGDAIFAVFRPDDTAEHPVIRAGRAGLAMRQALHALNADRVAAGQFPRVWVILDPQEIPIRHIGRQAFAASSVWCRSIGRRKPIKACLLRFMTASIVSVTAWIRRRS